MLRRLYVHVLTAAGFGVLEAENGEQGLQVVSQCPGQLSLVIADVDMPVMGGLEFARVFRPQHPAVPILFITGHGIRSERVELLEASGEVLRKPFVPQLLVESAKQMMAPCRSYSWSAP